MKFTLEVDCDNAAFGETEPERRLEVRMILKRLTALMDYDDQAYILRDSNGNRVGTAEFKES